MINSTYASSPYGVSSSFSFPNYSTSTSPYAGIVHGNGGNFVSSNVIADTSIPFGGLGYGAGFGFIPPVGLPFVF